MKKKHKKLAKGKLALKVASLLTCVALSSVGFAAWIIVKPLESQEAAGTIGVEDATSQSITLTKKWINVLDGGTEGKVVYGTKSIETGTDYGWLQNTSIGAECLTLTLQLTLTKSKTLQYDNKSIQIEFAPSNVAQFNTAISQPVDSVTYSSISAPVLDFNTTESADDVTYTTAGKAVLVWSPSTDAWTDVTPTEGTEVTEVQATTTVRIVFNWGNDFKNSTGTITNPYILYNSQPYDQKLATTAEANLDRLYSALDGVGYKLTLSEIARPATNE